MSGPIYPYDWRENPWKRPGRRVVVLPNEEAVFHDMVGHVGTAVRPNGRGLLVYFDNYIDLNVPEHVLADVPQGEHLFEMRNRIQ